MRGRKRVALEDTVPSRGRTRMDAPRHLRESRLKDGVLACGARKMNREEASGGGHLTRAVPDSAAATALGLDQSAARERRAAR